ncbi:hypothetical protein AaE_009179 [Aphanomyces astaci]|uniref:Uncharacterized protein n=1 Tax=Aphanomyces astaci TaxID=112090 RepID=A0A6A4ZXZ8_APHAT|nr:hypothetical protein AaE_009179 [Aphanomyces astaci]
MYKQLQRNDQTLALILEKILKGVREIVNENGVCAGNITRTVLESSITNALSLVSQSFGQFIVPTTTHNVLPTVSEYKVFHWGGKFHKLPDDFTFPSVDTATAWNLWWCGYSSQNSIPYRRIDTQDLTTRAHKNMFYEWKFIMEKLSEFYTLATGLALPPHPTEIDAIDAFAAESGLFNVISGEITSKRLRRDCQLKVTTMVRLVRQQDATKYSRPFKKRKLTSPKEPPALGRSLLL